MIFKAQVIAQPIRHVAHLSKVRDPLKPKTNDWNDEVAIVCSYNIFSGGDLNNVVKEMAAVASGSRCKKPYYTVAINPDRPGGMELTDEEAEYSAKRLLQELGFSPDHQWTLVRHNKNGRTHYHLLANRVNAMTLRAVHLSWNYRTQEMVARTLERFFDLPLVPGAFADRLQCANGRLGGTRPARRKRNHKEEQQAKHTTVPIATVDADLAWAWVNSTCGADFLARLDLRGYQLARGDRRDWVVVDPMGGVHSPTRRLQIRAAELRQRTQDLREIELPNLDSIRAELLMIAQMGEPPLEDGDEALVNERSYHQLDGVKI